MAAGLSIAKAWIKYNSNSLEENDEEEREPINIELTEQNIVLVWWKCYWLKWSGVQEEDEVDIALVNFIESLQKQTDEEKFPK